MGAELNRSAILENFMVDEELLFESIDLFLNRIDSRMENLRKNIADKNPALFMLEAHAIKGMVGIFSMGGAFEAVKIIELKGREKNVTGIDDDIAELETQLEELLVALRNWSAGR